MIDLLRRQLKDAGQSVTEPRVAVFKFLQTHEPATLAQVIAALTPAIDRASVYRTIHLFRQLSVVHDVVVGGRRMIELTDQFDSHHHHLSCLRCGTISTIDDPELERLLARLADRRGFVPSAHQIEVSGLCHKCYTKS
jgi:Fur family transcriptional regulator, ferric uptake regulator